MLLDHGRELLKNYSNEFEIYEYVNALERKKSISNLKTVQLYFIALSLTFYGIVIS